MNKKSSNLKPPTAPPVYRPQPLPRVLQKTSVVTGPKLPLSGQSSHLASIPRPQPTPKVLQRANALNPKQTIGTKPGLRQPQSAPAAVTGKTRSGSPISRPGAVNATARGRVATRGSVIQGLIVRMSKNHGLPVTSRDALSQAEVQDAVDYLESRKHGPTVDFFTDAGHYEWEKGDWKGGARNYIVSHADAQHGLGMPAGELAKALQARGLVSGMQLKLIACSMAGGLVPNNSQAQQLKNALKSLDIDVDITAAPSYVTYSKQGKLLHLSVAPTEDDDPNDPSKEEYEAYNKFVVDATEIVTSYCERNGGYNDKQFVTDPSLSELTKLMRARGINLSQFQKVKDSRTTRQANDLLMAAIRSEAKKKTAQDRWMTAVTAVISSLGAEDSQKFEALQKSLYIFSLQQRPEKVNKFFAAWRRSPFIKDAFKVDSNHPHRAPRTGINVEWKKF